MPQGYKDVLMQSFAQIEKLHEDLATLTKSIPASDQTGIRTISDLMVKRLAEGKAILSMLESDLEHLEEFQQAP